MLRARCAAALVVLLALSACGEAEREVPDQGRSEARPRSASPSATAAPSPSPDASPSAEASLPSPALTDAEADVIYVTTVRQRVESSTDSDATIASVGRGICARLREGLTPEEYALALIANGVTPQNAGVFIGAAPPAYCTDQEARVNAFLRSQ